ncbi:hypothetical protein NDU88_002310 [Pleurodeles waltl]|uniref:Uncharacterized protein n=1 Tax=Pleurodeles waltl TaxID=8319 RepID=A0AAV7Q8Z5_PLEWA|nr:hypothetical protein NDU88_002310 [Pleurodeles waltl]
MKIEDYNALAQDEVTHLGRYTTARTYGEGKRPSAALFTLIRCDREADGVLSVMDERRMLVNGAPQVLEQFWAYYSGLYKSQIPYNEEATTDYLEHIAMNWLSDAHRERLISPLRPAEIAVALKGMANGKSPV